VAAYISWSLLTCVSHCSEVVVPLVSTDNELPEDGVTAPKHVGAVLRQSLVHSLVNK
jgi:hypothetical protein